MLSLNTNRKHLIQSPGQCIHWQACYSIIITIYPLYQTAPNPLESISSCFIPETNFCFLTNRALLPLSIPIAHYSHGITCSYVFSYLLLRYISKFHLCRLIKLDLTLRCLQAHTGVHNMLLIRQAEGEHQLLLCLPGEYSLIQIIT